MIGLKTKPQFVSQANTVGELRRELRDELKRVYQDLDQLNQTKAELTSLVPVTLNSPGSIGQVVFSNGFLYVAIANNTWVQLLALQLDPDGGLTISNPVRITVKGPTATSNF